ncbi:TrmH family RNA methyltransferase [Bacillus thermophilus]|uniref:TrmH family RNA methyltransferase n=1 Tax=Siminovitchia thermophila TaxID=1245522 RepID=A0ABS2R856_9BACI|nr:RNA methyltransferase [Siminovitchia thermophila]MBM7714766.1 TrmH family RNA methyltransferase [Siminovitchia thermophila]ONK24468.1 RNA methyltransferase [Bacillus sp. VT-16-64]
MDVLQSVKNPRVKAWKKLNTKKGRDQTGTYLIEGAHLIEEALKTDELIELMIEHNQPIPEYVKEADIPITFISPEICHVISGTETPQGMFALCKKKLVKPDPTVNKRFLLLDGVQDPGNIGTMIRTADAAGVEAVIFGEGTGDLYNPKVIRSAQGSHFHLQIASGNVLEWIPPLKAQGIPVYGTALRNAVTYKEIRPAESFALIVGNEGAGVSERILDITDQNIYIPIYGKSESLNVAVAAGILMYHLRT